MPPPEQGWTLGDRRQRLRRLQLPAAAVRRLRRGESQNWFMVAGTRKVGPGRLTLTGMLSLEPLTIGRLVYAGDGGMSASTPSRRPASRCRSADRRSSFRPARAIRACRSSTCSIRTICSWGSARPIASSGRASPTCSAPISSARRRSARRRSCTANRRATTRRCRSPTTTSTRRTSRRASLRAGVETGPLTFEASVFRGEEPDQDDNRYNIETPRARLVGGARRLASRTVAGAVLRRAPARARVVRAVRDDAAHRVDRLRRRGRVAPARRDARVGPSSRGQRLQRPRRRLSARMGSARDRSDRRSTAALEVVGETDLRPRPAPARASTIRTSTRTSMPLTLGLVRDIGRRRWGRLGIGADVTVYRMSDDLIAFFDGSRSFHVFLRWRPVRTSMAHVH